MLLANKALLEVGMMPASATESAESVPASEIVAVAKVFFSVHLHSPSFRLPALQRSLAPSPSAAIPTLSR